MAPDFISIAQNLRSVYTSVVYSPACKLVPALDRDPALSLYLIRQARRAPPRGAAAGSPKPRSELSGLLEGDGKQQAIGLGRLMLPGQARAPCAWAFMAVSRARRPKNSGGGAYARRGRLPGLACSPGISHWSRARSALTVSAGLVLRVVLAVQAG